MNQKLETLFIPAANPDSRRLMVVMHGLGDSLESYRMLPSEVGLPWLNYLLVNAPKPYGPGFSWFDFPGDPTPGAEQNYLQLREAVVFKRPSPRRRRKGASRVHLLAGTAPARSIGRLSPKPTKVALLTRTRNMTIKGAHSRASPTRLGPRRLRRSEPQISPKS
jgi:hypothetical protein